MRRAALVLTVVCIAALIQTFATVQYRAARTVLHAQERTEVLRRLSDLRGQLQHAANETFLLVNGMVAYVSANPAITTDEFLTFARELTRFSPFIRSVTLAPENVIRFVYPLEGNEAVMGLDLTRHETQGPTALRAMRERTTVIAGPFLLVQGDVAIVNRTPIYTTNELGQERYWGLTSIPIVMGALFEATGLVAAAQELRLGLRGADGLGAEGGPIWGDQSVFDPTVDAEFMEVPLPSGSWQLGAAPLGGWGSADPRWILYTGVLTSLGFALLAGLLLNERFRRDELNRTLQEYIAIVDDYVITSTTDPVGIITSVSEAFSRISGYSKEELIGKSHNIVRHPDMPAAVYRDMWATIQSGRVWTGELKNKMKCGDHYWVDVRITPVFKRGRIVRYTAVRQDITNRKRIEELSIRDELTKLHNRRHFNDVLPRECSRARRDGQYLTLVVVDVDHFKQFNDHYGHQAGDEVLSRVGATLSGFMLRGGDYAFRLGGEEFGLLFTGLEPDEALMYLQRVIAGIRELQIPHQFSSTGSFLTASAGLATRKGASIGSADEMYKLADDALYEAKRLGRNRAEVASTTAPG